jgi:predicted ATP-grasp superfamily ATP-dependent carboligase
MKRRVLVTDGEQRAALAVVRSLGRAGHEVYVCSARARSLAGASRYCAGALQVADPLRQSGSFVDDVARLAAERKVDVLLPITEAALLSILPRRDRFQCAIPFPSFEAFEALCDKAAVLNAAAAHGIAVPTQTLLETPSAASKLGDDVRFPVVLKPSRSVAGSEGFRVRVGVSYATTRAELQEALERIPVNAYPVLLQQQIHGPGFGISVLVWDGELVAAFGHRRIREKPPSGGVSVLRESAALDVSLLGKSIALLRDFDWRGVAMVEYKLDATSGRPYLMEINGRLWGSLQLAIDAGVDFPRLLVELPFGSRPTPVTSYEVGVRSRWEWGDVDHFLASVLHPSRFARFSNAKRSGRLNALASFISGFGGSNRAEVFRRDDPGPIIRETLDWLRRR